MFTEAPHKQRTAYSNSTYAKSWLFNQQKNISHSCRKWQNGTEPIVTNWLKSNVFLTSFWCGKILLPAWRHTDDNGVRSRLMGKTFFDICGTLLFVYISVVLRMIKKHIRLADYRFGLFLFNFFVYISFSQTYEWGEPYNQMRNNGQVVNVTDFNQLTLNK